MAEHILFVFEGEKTENQIANNLLSFFIKEEGKVVVKSAYKTDIYWLYSQIIEDGDLDIFHLLKEKNDHLKEYSRDIFSQIYLFFDYDGHISTASPEKVETLLTFFNEETDNGKLYISYPMVEAIKCYKSRDETKNFRDLCYVVPQGSSFKQFVDGYVALQCRDLTCYSQDHWMEILHLNLKKYNWITSDKFDFSFDELCQNRLLEAQIYKFINPHNTVSVIASFPIMLTDYYGKSWLTGFVGNSD